MKKLATTLMAGLLATTMIAMAPNPAEARRYRDGAVAFGIAAAVIAGIALSRRDRYYDDDYYDGGYYDGGYYDGGYYSRGYYPRRSGFYYNGYNRGWGRHRHWGSRHGGWGHRGGHGHRRH